GRVRPPSRSSRVDLPQPLGPTRTVNSPAAISRSMPSSAVSRVARAGEPASRPRRLTVKSLRTCSSTSLGTGDDVDAVTMSAPTRRGGGRAAPAGLVEVVGVQLGQGDLVLVDVAA